MDEAIPATVEAASLLSGTPDLLFVFLSFVVILVFLGLVVIAVLRFVVRDQSQSIREGAEAAREGAQAATKASEEVGRLAASIDRFAASNERRAGAMERTLAKVLVKMDEDSGRRTREHRALAKVVRDENADATGSHTVEPLRAL